MKYLTFMLLLLCTPFTTLAQTIEQDYYLKVSAQLNAMLVTLQNLKRQVVEEEVLERLIACESGGQVDAVNPADAKVNGYPSKGILQFSPKTFLLKGKEYGFFPKSYTLADSNPLIWDVDLQKSIAKNMLLNEKEGWRHWKICSLRHGIPELLTSL